MIVKLGRKSPKNLRAVLRGAQLYFQLLAVAGVFGVFAVNARAELPATCTAQCAAVGGPSQWITQGNASLSTSGDSMTVHQRSDKAILNWQKFDVGSQNTVNFRQPSSTSAALNRVWDAQGRPSQIMGSINANGQVFIVNRNGMVFGKNAKIDVNSLIASSLEIKDESFTKSLLDAVQQRQAAFELQPLVDENGQTVNGDGKITIEGGASIKSGSNGRIMILAPEIESAGRLEAFRGQIILAAGDKVYIAQSDELRGLLVEVDNGGTVTIAKSETTEGEVKSEVISRQGNISIVGMAINQNGILRATTTVNLNGSIRLMARDSVKNPELTSIQTERTGEVRFGENSKTEVIPDTSDTATAIDGQTQEKSTIQVMGKSIHLLADAELMAPGGEITLQAVVNPSPTATRATTKVDDHRIVLEQGSRIDVSGSNVELAMEANVIEAELRGDELKDSPLQRDGVLRGEKIQVDIRDGTGVADLSKIYGNIRRSVGERTVTGGTIKLDSEGDVIVKQGASLDISGGSIHYQDGYITTTQLLSGGRVIDIADADPNQHFDRVLSPAVRRESGYVEGKDAGTLNIIGHGISLNGDIDGGVTIGRYQRDEPVGGQDRARPYTQVPLRGELIIGDADRASDAVANFRAPSILLTNYKSPVDIDFENGIPGGTPLELTPAFLEGTGINRIDLHSNGRIELQPGVTLQLADNGRLRLVAGTSPLPQDSAAIEPALSIKGSIVVPSGDVILQTKATENTSVRIDERQAIHVAEGALIDTRGRWVNDNPMLNTPAKQRSLSVDGGSVTIESAGDLQIGMESATNPEKSASDIDSDTGPIILAGGGAWLQSNGKVIAGEGGDVTIGSGSKFQDDSRNPKVIINGTISSYSLQKGGKLSVTYPGVVITDAANPVPAGHTHLASDFFQAGGFSTYQIKANQSGLTVAENTRIAPVARNVILNDGFERQTSAQNFAAFSRVGTLPELQRKPVNIELSSARTGTNPNMDARLTVESGAQIVTEAGGKVALTSDRTLVVDGTIAAIAGEISLSLTYRSDDQTFFPDKAVWLGGSAQLIASGYSRQWPNEMGLRQGYVLDAGTVSITTQDGYIVTNAGSIIDVSGAAEYFNLPLNTKNGSVYQTTLLAGNAGTVNLTAGDGMLLRGAMHAGAASAPGAAGGALSIKLATEYDRNNDNVATNFPTGKSIIEVRDHILAYGDDLQPGDPILVNQDGLRQKINNVERVAYISTEQIDAGGFDTVSLTTRPVMKDSNSQPNSGAEVRFFAEDGTLDLAVKRELILDAAVIASKQGFAGEVNLEAAHVALGSTNTRVRLDEDPVAGPASLTVNANLIDIRGELTLANFGSPPTENADIPIQFLSKGDIRFIGAATNVNPKDISEAIPVGRLRSPGSTLFSSAQTYATTLTQFEINIEAPQDGRAVFQGNGPSQAPLSAASRLTVTAPYIEQLGTLRAPLGTIELNAGHELTLGEGSVTSVSADGLLIPFGETQFELDWVARSGDVLGVVNAPSEALYDVAMPEKTVKLNAPSVDFAEGAVVDLSGGGDLYAYEFIPGPGGSKDVLLPENAGDSFAILPGFGGAYAPVSPLIKDSGAYGVGETVYLSGMEGLPAGEYTILPARYALLPGAFLLTPVSGTQGMDSGRSYTQLDGNRVVAGRRGVAGTGIIDSQWSGFSIESGSRVRLRAEYVDTRANGFFMENAPGTSSGILPRRPADAGTLVVDAGDFLNLQGLLRSDKKDEGRGSQLDIVSERIAVVTERTENSGRVELLADSLGRIGADSILIGGTRTSAEGGVKLNVTAREVVIGEGAELQVPELLLAASSDSESSGLVRIEQDAKINALAAASFDGDTLILPGDISLLRASAGEQSEIIRQSSEGGTSRLEVAHNAQLNAGVDDGRGNLSGGSLVLDAAGDAVSNGQLNLGEGGSLHLGASKISLGETGTQNITQGLVLSNAELSAISAAKVSLRSGSTIDLYGGVTVAAKQLKLAAQGLSGVENQGSNSSISADILTLTNSTGVDADLAGLEGANASLLISANRLNLGEGDESKTFSLQGYSDIELSASDNVLANGTGDLFADADLNIKTAKIGAANGAQWGIESTGLLTVERLAHTSAAQTAGIQGLGAKLRFAGAGVSFDTNLVLPSGEVELKSTGTPAQENELIGNVIVGSLAGEAEGETTLIDTSGRIFKIFDEQAASGGGVVRLVSQHGNVEVRANSTINVSGGGLDTAAGILLVSAPDGNPLLEGNFIANQNAGGELDDSGTSVKSDGNFDLDAASVNNLTALNQKLNAGGFNGERFIHARRGNIDFIDDTATENDAIIAQHVRLIADGAGDSGGNINIDHLIDASGARGGRVEIYAAKNLSLGESASIDAHASGYDQEGGSVLLSSAGAVFDFRQGARIDVNGTRTRETGDGVTDTATGEVHIRLPRARVETGAQGQPVYVFNDEDGQAVDQNGDPVNNNARNDTIPVASFNGEITGAGKVAFEAFQSYRDLDGVISAADIERYRQDADSFMQNAATILQALGVEDQLAYSVLPGVEVRSDGSLSLGGTWDLVDWRFENPLQTMPGVLTLRAGGALNMNHSLSDGLQQKAFSDLGVDIYREALLDHDSWTYNLIAGADLSSVALTQTGETPANMTVASNTLVRTGTGDINVYASGDLTLSNGSSVLYTAGKDDGFGSLDPLMTQLFLPGSFPTDGGDVNLEIGGSINGARSGQFINDWNIRLAGDLGPEFESLPYATAIAIKYSTADLDSSLVGNNFKQNIGALGGGNIKIRAAKDIKNLSVMAPLTAKPIGDLGPSGRLENKVRYHGTDHVEILAGGDIVGGVYYIGKGEGRIHSGGTFGAVNASGDLYPIIALGDARLSISANRDLRLETVLNPTHLSTSRDQPLSFLPERPNSFNHFYPYGKDSRLDLLSVNGDILLNNRADDQIASQFAFFNRSYAQDSNGATNNFKEYPASLTAHALQRSIILGGAFEMFPSATGELKLIAEDSVLAKTGTLTMSGTDPQLLPSAQNPQPQLSYNAPIHGPDPLPVKIYAHRGDIGDEKGISFNFPKQAHLVAGGDIQNLNLTVQNIDDTDVTLVSAGDDIIYDMSRRANGVFDAGNGNIIVDGPGRVDVVAGGTINLGTADGVLTRGNTVNSFLSERGADVTVMAGAANVDYAGFIVSYLKIHPLQAEFTARLSAQSLSDAVAVFAELASSQQLEIVTELQLSSVDVQTFKDIAIFESRAVELSSWVGDNTLSPYEAYLRYQDLSDVEKSAVQVELKLSSAELDYVGDVLKYRHEAVTSMRNVLNDPTVDENQALMQFALLPEWRQRPVVLSGFFNELKQSGVDAIESKKGDYSRGFDAIAKLFPTGRQTGEQHDLIALLSQIKTSGGGDINVLVPNGLVNAGVTATNSVAKQAKQLGLVVERQGDFNGFIRGDFIVNQSKVFTLGGGNLLIWSSEGDIDAGKGAKTALAAPLPLITFDTDGNVTTEFPPPAVGSGIAAFCPPEQDCRSDVYLFAPAGAINAGDAGIRAESGRIFLGGEQIIGADNISGEIVTNIPIGDSGGLGDMSIGDISASVAKEAEESVASLAGDKISDTPMADDALTFLEVEVLGFGDETPKVDDETNINQEDF